MDRAWVLSQAWVCVVQADGAAAVGSRREQDAVAALRPFLQEHAEHFWHELRCAACACSDCDAAATPLDASQRAILTAEGGPLCTAGMQGCHLTAGWVHACAGALRLWQCPCRRMTALSSMAPGLAALHSRQHRQICIHATSAVRLHLLLRAAMGGMSRAMQRSSGRREKAAQHMHPAAAGG